MPMRPGTQNNETHQRSLPGTVSATPATRRRRVVLISAVLLVVAGAVAAFLLTFRPMSSDMPGMNHGAAAVPTSTPSPTMAGDMAGMDHGAATAPKSSPSPTMAGEMPGMEHGAGEKPGTAEQGKAHEDGKTAEVAADQPLAAVLGTFGVGSGAVMVSAGALRRRDRARNRIKAAARAARRSQA